MKKISSKIFAIVLSVLIMTAGTADAQRKRKGDESTNDKKESGIFTARTATIISGAAELVKTGGKNTAYLTEAKKLQEEAKAHFTKNETGESVKKSYLARRYAFLAYEANGGTVPQKWRLTTEESTELDKYMTNKPTDQELKNKVQDNDHGRKKKEDGNEANDNDNQKNGRKKK